MKKSSLLYIAAIILGGTSLVSSCKKPVQPTYPTPDNTRLLSYNHIYTISRYRVFTINDNYRFSYDNQKRLSQILYSTNDSVGINKNIQFSYVADTIYKTTYKLEQPTLVLRRDTFIRNSQGQILSAHLPDVVYNFNYFGKLLSREVITYRDSGSTVSGTMLYTADNHDFLKRSFDGMLTATFRGDSGVKPEALYPDTTITLPLTVSWRPYAALPLPTDHNNVNQYRDQFSGYTGEYAVGVTAIDANGVSVFDSVSFPAGYWPSQTYGVYKQLDNRPGDYLQIVSFTMYGANIYQNDHLIKTITNQGHAINVAYQIEANSKITKTELTIIDSVGSPRYETYNLQYESF